MYKENTQKENHQTEAGETVTGDHPGQGIVRVSTSHRGETSAHTEHHLRSSEGYYCLSRGTKEALNCRLSCSSSEAYKQVSKGSNLSASQNKALNIKGIKRKIQQPNVKFKMSGNHSEIDMHEKMHKT